MTSLLLDSLIFNLLLDVCLGCSDTSHAFTEDRRWLLELSKVLLLNKHLLRPHRSLLCRLELGFVLGLSRVEPRHLSPIVVVKLAVIHPRGLLAFWLGLSQA